MTGTTLLGPKTTHYRSGYECRSHRVTRLHFPIEALSLIYTYAPYVTISHENKSAGSIVLIPDLGLNQLKEHVELELTRTFGTYEVNKIITVPFKSIGIDYRQILALKVSAMPQSILR